MFPMIATAPDSSWGLLAAAGIGLLVGFEAMLLSTSLYRIEDLFHKLPVHWMWWPAIGAIIVGLGGLIDAHVLGAGYASIEALLTGSLALKVVVALLAVKALVRSEEHTSELQSLMRSSYAVICLKTKKHIRNDKSN